MLSRKQALIRESGAPGSVVDFMIGSRTWPEMKISLPGEHQVYNALTVLAALDELEKQGIRFPRKAVVHGLAHTFWPGRLEWCGNVLMDGAHNAQGVTAFADFVSAYLKDRRKVLLTGVLKEKLSDEMLSRLAGTANEAVTVTPDSPRAMRADELAELLAQKGIQARAANNLKEGLRQAKELAGNDGVVLATGSLYFIGALRNELGLDI